MVNRFWFFMIVLGIASFIIRGDNTLIKVITESSQRSVELLLALLGIMAFWSGIMRIAEKSGLVEILSKVLSLPLRFIFPGLYQRSKSAFFNIIMNITSNMLGLSNAATPFGLKAMEELQKINPKKDTASDYMVTFLIINSASLQIIPTTLISLRASLGSNNPTSIITPIILTSLISLIIALILDRFFRRIFK
ncbi:nucleoside recognition domain-containing protein [Caloramator sp. CAR-1]|uniref:nucleoside recognition domain-containing protein n=1 Tax=Caloramator sp. CAR-1 TaxID=3062777 RepID=UPI0026E2F0E8|nr:nucleoside recognition domain-containing protein [Caloramator sp. CAR-1]MDO6355001.1 nucleoside recognition domain-containing protein [Caloramator sp. CAR-1]